MQTLPHGQRSQGATRVFALNIFVDGPFWTDAPIDGGTARPATATEVVVELKPPPQRVFADSRPGQWRQITCDFASSPDVLSRLPLA